MSAAEVTATPAQPTPVRPGLGLAALTAIVVGSMIGSGIFALPSQMAGSAAPDAQIGARLAISPGATAHPEGYELTVSDAGINVVGSTAAGVHYGVLTLTQIIAQRDGALPHLRCTDWPDFPNRGVMLDVSRNKVPSMATLYTLIERLAGWKINQIQLYTEHTFAFRRHPKAWADESPITGEEILALDAFCRERFIELVPNQNTFGHLHHWLDLPEYTHLAESPEGADTPWGFYRPGPFSISPAVPESMDLVRDMLDELLPHFSSGQVNIGGGAGAGPHSDGASGVHVHMSNTRNTPVEALEYSFPIRLEAYALREGSGGTGLRRGGEGLVRAIRFLGPATVTITAERRRRGPYGLAGGAPGAAGRNLLWRKGKTAELPGKTSFAVEPGDVVRIETPGGGGWGEVSEVSPTSKV